MDPLHLCIAIGPLAVYFLVLGLINLSRAPFLTTGSRDLGALGVAVSGLAVAGPMELFFPETAAARFGVFSWALLLAMYALLVLLICLLVRPRLVIYNVSETELREVLASALPQIDKHAQVTGDTILLPTLGVQAHIDAFNALRNVQLVASGPRQSYNGWLQLEMQLGQALKTVRVPPNPYGVTLLLFAGTMTVLAAAFMMGNSQSVAQALRDMMRW